METNDELKQAHRYSREGIFNCSTIKKMLKSKATKVSAFLSFLITAGIVYLYHDDYNKIYELLCVIVNTTLSLLPNLLGFCIGGYALIIGAGNIELLKKMSAPLTNSDRLSYFQVLSSVFAMSLIIQCGALIFAYILNILLNIELIAFSYFWGMFTNVAGILIVLLLTITSLLLLYYTVINIFNFGQATHFAIRLDKRNELEKNKHNNE